MNEMRAIDIARRLAELGQTQDACQAYTLAIQDAQKAVDPDTELEAALYMLNKLELDPELLEQPLYH